MVQKKKKKKKKKKKILINNLKQTNKKKKECIFVENIFNDNDSCLLALFDGHGGREAVD